MVPVTNRDTTRDLGNRNDTLWLLRIIARKGECFNANEEPRSDGQYFREARQTVHEHQVRITGRTRFPIDVSQRTKAEKQHNDKADAANDEVEAPEEPISDDVDLECRHVGQQPDQGLITVQRGLGLDDHVGQRDRRRRHICDILEHLIAADEEAGEEAGDEAERAP